MKFVGNEEGYSAMRTLMISSLTTVLFFVAFGELQGQEVAKPDAATQAKYDRFSKLLTGAKFKGSFTLDGRPLKDLHEEEYEIDKVEKMPDPDLWALTARIKYGDKDVVVPVPLFVKWAGETPVLTLDNLTLPGLGTFSSRVVLHGDKYAGTWVHDDKGGHLFGHIILAKQATEPQK
jgi:hypothetical protein